MAGRQRIFTPEQLVEKKRIRDHEYGKSVMADPVKRAKRAERKRLAAQRYHSDPEFSEGIRKYQLQRSRDMGVPPRKEINADMRLKKMVAALNHKPQLSVRTFTSSKTDCGKCVGSRLCKKHKQMSADLEKRGAWVE